MQTFKFTCSRHMSYLQGTEKCKRWHVYSSIYRKTMFILLEKVVFPEFFQIDIRMSKFAHQNDSAKSHNIKLFDCNFFRKILDLKKTMRLFLQQMVGTVKNSLQRQMVFRFTLILSWISTFLGHCFELAKP